LATKTAGPDGDQVMEGVAPAKPVTDGDNRFTGTTNQRHRRV